MSSFLRIDDYESYEKPNNDFTNLNQHSNKRVLDKISTRKDIISHAPSTPSYTSHSKKPFNKPSSSSSPLNDLPQNTNDIHLKIYTNDYHMKSTPIFYHNTSSTLNDKYRISYRLLARKEMISSRANNLREHNTTTRTFFNFTYKKYHFHFGIYPLFSTTITFTVLHPCNKCQVPSPFVMSQCRRSCVMHQQLFFRNDTFNNVRNHGRQDLTSTITTPVNDKRSHANLLHDRWNCRWKKDVVSQRLGISYKESYLARTKGLVIHHEHNRLDTMKHQLITAQRYRFLFLPSQYIYKPIKYLQYTHGLDYPDYGFKIPYNQEITPKKDLLIYTVEQYNPIPNGFFPSKYKDIIPKKPLYTASGEFIIPGSREWFTYMYKLDLERKSTPPPSRSSLEERQQLLVKENDRIQDLIKGKGKQEAALHGTSNINFQLKLYQEMTTFNDAFNLGKSISVIPPMTNDELYVPSKGGRYYINNPSQ
ncbi:hypothetical protein GLOIN_2v1781434 [Rhizophagus irregularis DAOM 181602=DAOM 197198]|uniref:DUF8211 domain-containing protein n=1 Tax=Rhizophagus irregularis (strain DAOM 181602 / DAOM 197198 / MUCL 43194) TaxID=747089 RepID=A0A2P4PJX1_RHIID|nr:hypothetical protein GLOIN_2v1781434 [Rhizophagus irregularis DAOM 181602=DAOM 197198]POG65686.1 hypothetical protein GLOIN_2v1781434 [Rhizophagus irregularis DAOM 181602=DAOM 197198]|eukprot:XP_025172552.1 hypothetical protein GLOIN_2v1781434 [Rhizophagus irregularis DAOM 181602=DAOM 197198]